MKCLRLLILSLAMMDFCVPASITAEVKEKPKTHIRLPKEYAVQERKEKRILLGELAEEIKAPDAESAKKLARVEVMDTPQAGEHKRISQPQILLAMRLSGYDYLNVILEGASTIEVYGPGFRVSVQDMVKAICRKAQKETGWSDDELVIRILNAPNQDAWLPGKPAEIIVDRLQPMILGTSRFEVGFYIDKILVAKVPFEVSVSHKRKVYYPTRQINPEDVIRAGDLREEVTLIDQVQYDDMYVDNKEDLIGRRTRTQLNRREPIRWQYLETNYILKQGDIVQMLIRNQGFSLQTMAQVQMRAAVGDVILVKTVGTNRLVKAKVVSSNLVEMVSS